MTPKTPETEEFLTTVRQLEELTEWHLITWVRKTRADSQSAFSLKSGFGDLAELEIYKSALDIHVSVIHKATRFRRVEGVEKPQESTTVREATFLGGEGQLDQLLAAVERAVTEDEIETLRLIGHDVAVCHQVRTKDADIEKWKRERGAKDKV
jgi:hypothetical protein